MRFPIEFIVGWISISPSNVDFLESLDANSKIISYHFSIITRSRTTGSIIRRHWRSLVSIKLHQKKEKEKKEKKDPN